MTNLNYNIAVFSISGIGNTIFAVPMLRLLRQSYPEAKITLFVRFKAAKDLLSYCSYVDEIIIVDYSVVKGLKNKLRLIFNLRRRKFELNITAFPSEKREKNFFSYLIGAPVRVSHKYIKEKITDLGFLQTARVPVDITIHDLDQNMLLLSALGIDISHADRQLQVWVPEADEMFAFAYLKKLLGEEKREKKIIIGFHAGSSDEFGMTHKRWGIHNFARLADMIIEKYNALILLFGGPEEKDLKYGTAQQMKNSPVIIEKTSIQKDAALIKNCDLFVSNDSGNMNLALALGVKTIGLFGPVGSVRADLKNEQHKVIKSPAPCSPCWSIANISEPLICTQPEVICMKQITVERVFRAVEEYLSELDKTVAHKMIERKNKVLV